MYYLNIIYNNTHLNSFCLLPSRNMCDFCDGVSMERLMRSDSNIDCFTSCSVGYKNEVFAPGVLPSSFKEPSTQTGEGAA